MKASGRSNWLHKLEQLSIRVDHRKETENKPLKYPRRIPLDPKEYQVIAAPRQIRSKDGVYACIKSLVQRTMFKGE